MDFTYTDLLLIAVLWFQIANLLYQLWPRLMRLKLRGKSVSKEKETSGLDSYELWKKAHPGGEEKHEA